MIDGKIFFDVPKKNKEEVYEKTLEMSKNDDYTIRNLFYWLSIFLKAL